MPTELKSDVFAPSERDRLLRAMAELCRERGYMETSTAALLERAEVSESDFEQIFNGSLEECLLGAVNQVLGETMSVVSLAYSVERSELDSLLEGAMAILELMAAKPSYAYLGFIVGRQTGPERAKGVYDSGAQILVAMLERLAESASPTPPPGVARVGLGGAEAVVRARLAAGQVEELPRALPTLIYGATVAYLGNEEALRLAARARRLVKESRWA